MTDIAYGVQFTADGSAVVGEQNKIERSTKQLNKEFGKTGPATERATKGAQGLTTQTGKLRLSMGGASAALRRLGAAAAAAAVAFALNDLLKIADTYSLIRARLSLVTGSTRDLVEVQRELFDISQDTRIGFETTAALYTRLARSTKDLDLSQRDLLSVTTAIQQSIIVSGSTAAESSAGLIQFAQGLQSSRLAGDELRSVLEQMPRLAEAIARGLGVSIGELRDLGSEGKLTAEQVLGAIQKEAPQIAEEFARMSLTVDQSLTKVSNSLGGLVSRLDAASGASSGFARLISGFAEGLDAVADLFFPDAISQIEELDEVIRGLETRLSETPDNFARNLIEFGSVTRSGAEQVLQLFREQRLALETELAEGESRPRRVAPTTSSADQDAIDKAKEFNVELARQIDQLQRLELANRLGADSVDLVTDAIAAENAVAKLKIETESALAKEIFNRTLQVEGLKRAIDAQEESDKRHQETIEEIRDRLLDTRPAYEAAIEAANRWRTEALAGLDETKAGYDNFVRSVETIFQEQIKEALEEAERDSSDWAVAARRALKDVAEESENSAETIAEGIRDGFDDATDAIVEFATTGKVSFSGLVDSMIADLLRLQVQQNLTGPIAGLLGQIDFSSLFRTQSGGGGGAPVAAQIAHAGARAGHAGPRRLVPPETFTNAPRAHRGALVPGEVPVITQQGEGIFTPRQMENADRLIQALAQAKLSVTVINNSRASVAVRERQNTGGGRDLDLVIDEVQAQNIGRGGETADAILNLTGAAPQTIRR